MKFKVLFFKRKHIYYCILVFVVLMFFAFSLLTDGNTSYTTFNVGINEKSIKKDLTGDGKKDTLYIIKDKDKYHLEIATKKSSFYLKPSEKLPTMGKYSSNWPMRIELLDVSRDKIPEIFVQSSQNNKSIQHVFTYQNNQFKDIFTSYNNILGFIDCSNNKTPKVISGIVSENNFAFSNYMLLNNKFEKYYYKTEPTFMGKDTILCFIDLITRLNPNSNNYNKDIFHSKLEENSLDIISTLANSASNFIFQDGTFIDIKSNNNGKPITIQWTLNFRANSKASKNTVKNYTLKLNLIYCENSKENFNFKISSIHLLLPTL